MAEAKGRPKDVWDKLSTLSGVLAAILVPLAVALVGSWYTAAIKERELQLSREISRREWVQVGLDILRDPDVEPSLRKWGVKIVSEYGGIKIEEEVKEALATGKATLPRQRPIPCYYDSTMGAWVGLDGKSCAPSVQAR